MSAVRTRVPAPDLAKPVTAPSARTPAWTIAAKALAVFTPTAEVAPRVRPVMALASVRIARTSARV